MRTQWYKFYYRLVIKLLSWELDSLIDQKASIFKSFVLLQKIMFYYLTLNCKWRFKV